MNNRLITDLKIMGLDKNKECLRAINILSINYTDGEIGYWLRRYENDIIKFKYDNRLCSVIINKIRTHAKTREQLKEFFKNKECRYEKRR